MKKKKIKTVLMARVRRPTPAILRRKTPPKLTSQWYAANLMLGRAIRLEHERDTGSYQKFSGGGQLIVQNIAGRDAAKPYLYGGVNTLYIASELSDQEVAWLLIPVRKKRRSL